MKQAFVVLPVLALVACSDGAPSKPDPKSPASAGTGTQGPHPAGANGATGPVDPGRLLAAELIPGSLATFSGMIAAA